MPTHESPRLSLPEVRALLQERNLDDAIGKQLNQLPNRIRNFAELVYWTTAYLRNFERAWDELANFFEEAGSVDKVVVRSRAILAAVGVVYRYQRFANEEREGLVEFIRHTVLEQYEFTLPFQLGLTAEEKELLETDGWAAIGG